MSLFGRRDRLEPLQAAPEPADTIVRAQGTYRIAVAHTDPGHPNATPAHWGPAYNAAFADTIAHVKGISAGQVDLLEEAKASLDRCREEHPGHDVWVERLVSRGGDSEWERVI